MTGSVCIVTPGHPSENPRLVKEADALADEGYQVQIVAGDYHPWGHDADEAYADRDWQIERVSYGAMAAPLRRAYLGGRKRVAATLASILPGGTPALRHRAHHWVIPELAKTVQSIEADLYIAHYLPALPAAVWAAEHHGAKVGFDAEDLHRGQFHGTAKNSRKAERTRWVEETYMPRCDYVTAASPGIAETYAKALDIPEPTTILNVFPCHEQAGQTPPDDLDREHPGDEISLYWYSQTIGPDRGLETIVRALGKVRERKTGGTEVTLSLRGSWADGYEAELRELARSVGLTDAQIRHLSREPPEQLIERASQHDIGLALEQAASPKRDVCVTNKIFAYLQAGLPVVATDTQGQRYVHEEAPGAVALCPLGDAEAMADRIMEWMCAPDEREQAAQAAGQAAAERFNWNVERQQFLATVRTVLDQ